MQYLSIDVALGSVGSSVLAAKVVGAKLPWSYWLMLPLCVWIIYTADHLLDARKLKEQSLMDRHRFHYLHGRTIGFFLVLAILTSMVLMLTLNFHILIFGMCVYVFLLMYFIVNQFRNHFFRIIPRELVIALGYMAGTWGIPMLSRYSLISRMDLVFFLIHFLVILSIPLLYAICEQESDVAGGFVSFATVFGTTTTSVVISAVLSASTLLSIFSIILFKGYVGLVLLLMTLVLVAVFEYRRKLSVEKLRFISDGVNFLPFLLMA